MRVLCFGAGVIGRIYAARFMAAGHEVSLLSRGAAASSLRSDGITLVRTGTDPLHVFPLIIEDPAEAHDLDIAFIAIRLDQLDAALPSLQSIQARTVVSFVSLPCGTDDLQRSLGVERYVPAFPGVAGCLEVNTVRYTQIAQQPTTVGLSAGSAAALAILASAGFPTTSVPDMDSWLKTHTIFIAAFESALLAFEGDSVALAADAPRVRGIVEAVREGFEALEANDVTVTPAALRVIFQRVPLWFAAAYWKRQLAGTFGKLELAPHSLASRHTELPSLQQGVRALLGGQATPMLERLFRASADAH
jgi:2-dehydropantoate 2-reductase